jgi:hypothetical protein
MGFSDWMRVFRSLHETAKGGGLKGQDAQAYRAGCNELARALIAAQKRPLPAGETPLDALRVARAVQVELAAGEWLERITTLELGVSGFSALLAKAPPQGEELRCTLKLPGGAPLQASARMSEAKQQTGTLRASFAFQRLDEAQRAKLERLVIDTALEQIAA